MIIWHFWFNSDPTLLLDSITIARSPEACLDTARSAGFYVHDPVLNIWRPYGFKLERLP